MQRGKTKGMLAVEEKYSRPIDDIIADLLAELGSQAAVAREVGITEATMSRWLERLGFTPRRIIGPTKAAAGIAKEEGDLHG